MADILQGGGGFWGSGKDLDCPKAPTSYAFVTRESKTKSARLKAVPLHEQNHVHVGDVVDIDRECQPPSNTTRRTGVVHSWYHGAFSTAEKLRYALYKNPSATSIVVDGYTVKLFEGEWLFPFDYPIPDWVIANNLNLNSVSAFVRQLELTEGEFLATMELKVLDRQYVLDFFEKYNVNLVDAYLNAVELDVSMKEYLEVFI